MKAAHAAKMKVVPTALVKLKDAIEFTSGCSMDTPSWHAAVGV
jgi:hypothetical protein